MKILANGRVDHPRVDRERLPDRRERVRRGRCGESEYAFRAEFAHERPERAVRRTMVRFEDVVRFVDHDEVRSITRAQEFVAMIRRELRCGQDHVPRSILERRIEIGSLGAVDRAIRAQDPQTESGEPARHRLVLIVRQRAQRIEDDRLLAARERAFGRRQLKAQRFSTPRSQHGERVSPGIDAREYFMLRLA